MNIGVPKEIKNNEKRVSITPSIVKDLVNNNHKVFIEKDAGKGSGFLDKDYIAVGAKIVNSSDKAWDNDLVIKVKEPLKEEYKYFKKGLLLFTYLHLAAERELTKALLEKGVTAFAYETLIKDGKTPLLRPMSIVAGKRSVTIGAHFLESHNKGKGLLLGGVDNTYKGTVTILGGGIAGEAAAKNALGLGAKVILLELNDLRIKELKNILKGEFEILKSTKENITKSVKKADLLISTVLIPGEKAPKLVTEEMIKEMEDGSVVIDISIDQGGTIETIDKITTLDDPIFIKHGVLHYSVANMPGATPRSSTEGLTNATKEYILLLANNGFEKALKINNEFLSALNTHDHKLVNKSVGMSLDIEVHDI